MKIVNVHGVDMTRMHELKFSKYLSSNNIAMSVFSAEERTNITKKWLMDYMANVVIVSSTYLKWAWENGWHFDTFGDSKWHNNKNTHYDGISNEELSDKFFDANPHIKRT